MDAVTGSGERGCSDHTARWCAKDAKPVAEPLRKGRTDQTETSAGRSLKAWHDGGAVNGCFLKPKCFVKCYWLG